MKFVGIYHAPSSQYALCKQIGISHTEIALNAYPGSYDAMEEVIKIAHDSGLYAIIEPGFNRDVNKAKEFLEKLKLKNLTCDHDIISLYDEVNLFNIPTSDIILANVFSKRELPQCSTMISLSWIKDFSNFYGICDYVGIDYYRHILKDPWSLAVFTYKVKQFQKRNKGRIIGIPPIRYSPNHLKWCFWYWIKIVGAEGLFLYSFTGDQEVPPWSKFDLSGLPDTMKMIKKLNNV